jgi:predicted dehydrogenase
LLLVGYGRRGRQWEAACRARRDAQAAGIVDPDPTPLEAARAAGLPAWPTLAEALDAARFEGAVVASPPQEHPDQTIACLRAGMPVLVEKPLALSLEAAARVAQESAATGVPVTVGQNFRFLRRELAVRKALELGVGRVLAASIVSARSVAVVMPHLAVVPHGPLWDICVHHLDALRVRFGSAPRQVAMSVRRLEDPGEVRLRLELTLDWAGGPAVLYQHSEGAPGYYHSEWLEGEQRSIVVRDQDVSVLFPSHRPRAVRVGRQPAPEQAVLDACLRSFESGESELAAADNLPTVAMLEAAVRSDALGRPVALEELGETVGVSLERKQEAHD